MGLMPELRDVDIAGMPARKLHDFMVNWRNWMYASPQKLGYPKKASGFVGGGYSSTFEDLCDIADIAAAEAVDALVESLDHSPRLAVHHVYLHSVFRLRDFEASYERAMESIAGGLIARGFW